MASKLKARDPAEVKAGKVRIVNFGPSGAGKTKFALGFPKPYFVDTDGGADLAHYQKDLAKSGGRYLGQEDGTLDFDFVIGQVEALATEKHEYQTLVIDSLTKLYQHRIALDADRLGEKDAFGASKKPAIAMMRKLVMWLQRLDMNVVVNCHEVSEWGVVNGQRTEIGKMPDCWDKLIYELDLTLQIRKLGKGSREAFVYKSRLTGFPEFDRFYLQKNEQDVGYAEFAARYGKDAIEAPTSTIVLASKEQVAEILRLLEIVKVSETDTEKILTKGKATTWAELAEDKAAATIAWLAGKVKPDGQA